jgi:hypothetical protein
VTEDASLANRNAPPVALVFSHIDESFVPPARKISGLPSLLQSNTAVPPPTKWAKSPS